MVEGAPLLREATRPAARTVSPAITNSWLGTAPVDNHGVRGFSAKCPLLCGARARIETAPTNKAILVRVPGRDYYGNKGVFAAMLVDMGTGRRWMTFGWAIGRDLGAEDAPDVWMPLPSPPPQRTETCD